MIDPSAIISMFGGSKAAQGPPPAPVPVDVSNSPGPLQGDGGGIDDLIPATVHDDSGTPQSQAALSPGEFVWPAAAVSFLGDGDSNFGATMLDAVKKSPKLLGDIRDLVRTHLGKSSK